MKNRRWSLPFALALGVVLVSGVVLAGVPKDKETITIDRIAGKKGAVEFPHAKHNEIKKGKDGKPVVCKTCHHTLAADAPKGDEKPQACTECHAKPGEAKKKVGDKEAPNIAAMKGDKVDQKSVLFHTRCLECHKALKKDYKDKKLAACTTCHKKK